MFYDMPPAPPQVVIFEDLAGKRDESPRRCRHLGTDCTDAVSIAVSILTPELNFLGLGRLHDDQPQDRGSGR